MRDKEVLRCVIFTSINVNFVCFFRKLSRWNAAKGGLEWSCLYGDRLNMQIISV